MKFEWNWLGPVKDVVQAVEKHVAKIAEKNAKKTRTLKIAAIIGGASAVCIACGVLLISVKLSGADNAHVAVEVPEVATPKAEAPVPVPANISPFIYQERGAKAREVLAGLEVREPAAQAEYSRALFGQTWADVDRNGCDTRNDILARDLKNTLFKPGSQNCVVVAGDFANPYTGRVEHFAKGTIASAITVDHVVALSDAWQKGAQALTAEERVAFANDPLNLLTTDTGTNSKKSDGDAAAWLPANAAYRCEYVSMQIAVKSKYRLWVTAAEKDAMIKVLDACPQQTIPVDNTLPALAPAPKHEPASIPEPAQEHTPRKPTPAPTPEPAPEQEPAPREPAPAPAPAQIYYKNCSAAKAAGVTPIYRGEPGYAKHLDRDGDGIACER